MKTSCKIQTVVIMFQCVIILLSVQFFTACTKPAKITSHEATKDPQPSAMKPPPPSLSHMPSIENKNEYKAEAVSEREHRYEYEPESKTASVREHRNEYEPKAKAALEPIDASEHKPSGKRTISKLTKSEKYKEYKAVLGADPTITIPGPPGRLKVWLGIPDYNPNFPEGMIQATGTLPARGVTAKITPFAPAFKVEPKESICMKIDPAGSEVSFTLTPTKGGTFDVGADVYLYDSTNCSGSAIPKGTTTFKVQVIVKIIPDTDSVKDVIRQRLLTFWGESLMLVFAVILFLIRKKLKKWIGFGREK